MGDWQPATDKTPADQIPTQDSRSLGGVPDAFQRLWTPHRQVYINGEARPKTTSEQDCPFCQGPRREDAESLIVYRGKQVFALLNLFPYNAGHLLICPYRHVSEYVDLEPDERNEFGEVTAQAIRVLKQVCQPHGFNLGMNQGQVAGAGIAQHLHQHIVPRWGGDANFFPIIAQTKAVPQLLGQARELISEAWADSCSDQPGPSRPGEPSGPDRPASPGQHGCPVRPDSPDQRPLA